MRTPIVEQYARAPSALRFMARAVKRSQRLPEDGSFPQITLRWTGLRVDPAQAQAFHRATGLKVEKTAPVLLPHVMGFRLQVALLTHPAYPLPIWTALQIRNQLIRHRAFDPAMPVDLETRVDGHRLVEKGIEVDLASRLTSGSACLWESRITYFHRGRFRGAISPAAKSPSLDPGRTDVIDRFRMPHGGGWDFGRLTGDYNGIHWWHAYARRFGFQAAFLHPQRAVGMSLARLPEPDAEKQTLDLWIKGPLLYGADVQLRTVPDADGMLFGLSLEGDPRMAMVGRWRNGQAQLNDV